MKNNNFNYQYNIDIAKIKNTVHKRIDTDKKERNNTFMKKKKILSIVAIIAIMTIGIGVGATVGGKSGWLSFSSALDEFKTLPTEEKVVKDIGYSPILIKEFSNGYKFSCGSIEKNQFVEEDGAKDDTFKTISFTYEKDGDKVFISEDKTPTPVDNEGTIVKAVNGIDIYYSSDTYKFVPTNYDMTAQDKEDEASGKYVFSYGSDKVEINKMTFAIFTKDDISYCLHQIDGKLSQDELVQMAEEMITK